MQVPDRSLLVGFDVIRPIRLIDCDILIESEPIEIQASIEGDFIDLEIDLKSEAIEIDTTIEPNVIEIELSVSFGGCEHEYYNGAYVLTPMSVDQTMHTKEKLMRDNVLFKEVPTAEVGNNTGYTFTIL